MEINLSMETINTIYKALRSNKQSLKRQLTNEKTNVNKKEILKNQLAEIEEALQIFEELTEGA